MQTNHSRSRVSIEVAPHRVTYHLPKFRHGIGLGEDIVAQRLRLVAALRRFLNGKDDLGFCHMLPRLYLAFGPEPPAV
jgi:hypothetical protein